MTTNEQLLKKLLDEANSFTDHFFGNYSQQKPNTENQTAKNQNNGLQNENNELKKQIDELKNKNAEKYEEKFKTLGSTVDTSDPGVILKTSTGPVAKMKTYMPTTPN
jgi:poly(3-hydroxyalkanoate) synthetase